MLSWSSVQWDRDFGLEYLGNLYKGPDYEKDFTIIIVSWVQYEPKKLLFLCLCIIKKKKVLLEKPKNSMKGKKKLAHWY